MGGRRWGGASSGTGAKSMRKKGLVLRMGCGHQSGKMACDVSKKQSALWSVLVAGDLTVLSRESWKEPPGSYSKCQHPLLLAPPCSG